MKRYLLKFSYLPLFFLVLLSVGCTDLEEQIVDEILLDESLADPLSTLTAAYGQLGNATFVSHGNVFALQQYTTDEAMLPTRGADWGDGGVWRAFPEFTWASNNAYVTTTWNNLNLGITKSLYAISTIEAREDFAEKSLYLAEARGLLAFYTYHTLDLYGQAPYRNPSISDAPLEIRQAATAIDELINEVETIIPDLADMGSQSTHSGRFTKQTAYAMLAEMYLNRAVYKDRYASSFNFSEAAVDGQGTDMDKVIEYSSLVINSGRFALESNYFHNFDIDNSNGTELIFVVVQDINNQRGSASDFAYLPVGRNQRPSPSTRGTNGSSITPEFYATWDGNHDDPRFHRHYQYDDGTWFMNDGTDVSVPATSLVEGDGSPWFHFNRGMQVGQQYGPTLLTNGSFQMTEDGRIRVNILYTERTPTLLLDFTPALNFDNPAQAILAQNQINRGVRPFKYEFDPENGNGTSNVDIPLYRLGGIYTMRAEAYFRQGNTAAALADINMLRTSRTREALFDNAPGVPLTTLTETALYNELGFELYWEMYRRKQMIRFGTFDLSRTAKSATDPNRRIFPIPQTTIDVAGDYYTQNAGY